MNKNNLITKVRTIHRLKVYGFLGKREQCNSLGWKLKSYFYVSVPDPGALLKTEIKQQMAEEVKLNEAILKNLANLDIKG